MESTSTTIYDFNTQIMTTTMNNNTIRQCNTYNLRSRRVDKNTIKNEVQNHISSLLFQKQLDSTSNTIEYNLRSSQQSTPRVNYYRFYTSCPDDYSHYHHIRRSPRIQSMTTPRPNYNDEETDQT